MISALMRLKTLKLLSKKRYNRVVSIFFYDIEHRYVIIPIDDRQIVEAIKLIEKYNLKTLDAIYLSVAKEIRNLMGEIVFVSSDKKLLYAAEGEGFDVLDPEDV